MERTFLFDYERTEEKVKIDDMIDIEWVKCLIKNSMSQ